MDEPHADTLADVADVPVLLAPMFDGLRRQAALALERAPEGRL